MKSDSYDPPALRCTQKASSHASDAEPHLPVRGPPPLDIHGDYELWNFRMDSLLIGHSQQDQYKQILLALSDAALQRAIAVGFSPQNSLSDNWRILNECFAKSASSSFYMHSFLNCSQEMGETEFDYLHRLRQIATHTSPSLSNVSSDELICTRFAQGILSYELKCQLLRNAVKSVPEALEVVKCFESVEHILSPTASTSCYTLEVSEQRRSLPVPRQRRPNAPPPVQPTTSTAPAEPQVTQTTATIVGDLIATPGDVATTLGDKEVSALFMFHLLIVMQTRPWCSMAL